MDVPEETLAGWAVSAHKRQRRNADSGDMSERLEAEPEQIGEEKPASTEESVLDSGGNNNNNKEGDNMMRKEQPTEDKPEQAEEEEAGPSFLEGQLSPQAASAVLAKKRSRTCSATTIDSDDEDEDEVAEQQQQPPPSVAPTEPPEIATTERGTSPRFNQRRIPSTRTYRRISSILAAINDTSADSVDINIPNLALPALNAALGEAAPEADVVSSPDDSMSSTSSSSSDAVWRRYDISSGSDSDSITDGDDVEMEFQDLEPNAADREQIESSVEGVMCKCKPAYSWNVAQELMHREHNIINRIGWRGGHTSAQSFAQGYYGSRQVVEQMALLHEMSKHMGCVNCLNFNRAGDLVCSGSDDLKIIVWDWAKNEPRHTFLSGHTMNIFQTKFIDSAGCLDIVSASRDGQVRRAVIPPSGCISKPTRLYSHTDAVHKLVVVPLTRHEVMSAGEDGAVKHFDLRTSTQATTMVRCVQRNRYERTSRLRLFSISHHPFAPEFCVSGSDDVLRVYDKRKLESPIHEMTPRLVHETKITQITCAVYNHSGSEILASYSDAGIYLFDSRNYTTGETLHCYEGHINNHTIKGVNFFGPRSEYIVSGSDCGNIFFWDKNTEAIVNYMKGDRAGVVNCLEPHPWMPVLATSGLESKVKIWAPNGPGSNVPDTDTLKQQLHRNFRRNVVDTDFEINQFQRIISHVLASDRSRRRSTRSGEVQAQPGQSGRQQAGDNSISSSTSNDSGPSQPASQEQQNQGASNSNSSDDATGDRAAVAAALHTMHCRTQ